jgi:two-component system phosphate regulon sensor histidine kinase PhoR/two-component system sensor histidine kinase VicK
MHLRARVHGKQIVLQLQPNLPAVAIDRITISEVIYNLVDNAIKYSGRSDRIIVKSYLSKDGLVETTVQDFGIGIPANIIGNLFEKFYRNHRTRAQVGGTGLGLYLSKSIVNAHGGQIWVQSKEGEGTIFGFSLVPYTRLAEELKKVDNKEDVTRIAHGWIKNHSFYRR